MAENEPQTSEDLAVLLKDEWRHKISIRDEAELTSGYEEQTVTLSTLKYGLDKAKKLRIRIDTNPD